MKHAAVRQRVVELCRDLSDRRFLAGTGGNVALRIDDAHVAVTPSATDYQTMTASDVSVLRLADLRQIEGDKPPSVESSLHARVLHARRDCECSIHTHQPVASACALLGDEIEVSDPAWWRMLGRRVPVVGYAPSGTRWLAAKLAAALRPDIHAYLMLNHGVLCCGSSVEAAVQTVQTLEALATYHLRALITARAAAHPAMRRRLSRVLDALADAASFGSVHEHDRTSSA